MCYSRGETKGSEVEDKLSVENNAQPVKNFPSSSPHPNCMSLYCFTVEVKNFKFSFFNFNMKYLVKIKRLKCCMLVKAVFRK